MISGKNMLNRIRNRRVVAATVVAAVVASMSVAFALPANAVLTTPGPVQQRTAAMVTDDALPTVQIDGVVWSEQVVGTTVWAGGSFANARPAGAAPGTNLTSRPNLLAFNITTGALITSIAPSLNAEVKVVAVSPDHSRVYVGGAFTTANGANHYRIAAYNASTGAIISSFTAGVDAEVNAIVATNTTVYVGGAFSNANGVARQKFAAFDLNGNLLGWAPTADNNEVETMVMSPDGTRLIAGGSFTSANGSASAYGLASLDPTTGALYPWAASSVVQDAGSAAAILQLTTDGTAIYGNGYVFGAGGDLEGSFSADPDTGTINWIEDCHGDTYGNYAMNGVLYTVSHAHYCGNVGGYPQTEPTWTFQHTVAFTTAATGTLAHNTESPGAYTDFGGQPSPSLINWFPTLQEGTYTGQSQSAWSVTGNGTYLVEGGEFPSVNGVAQQGLVRFATPPTAPSKMGPTLSGSFFTSTNLALSSTSIRVSWPANYDPDDENLTYKLVRNGDINHPIYTATQTSQFWNRPTMSFTDTGLTPGTTYQYRLFVTDPDGNQAAGDTTTASTPSTNPGPYAAGVLNAGAADYWRLDETSGTTATDWAGFNNLTEGAGVTHNTAGAIIGDPDTADTFSGTNTGWAESVTAAPAVAPNTYTMEAWIKTSTTAGGKIVGFGSGTAGTLSGSYDRQIYMDNAGHLIYGVYTGTTSTLATSATFNDNTWHHVVGTLSAAGMNFYVDGKLVGHNATVTAGQVYEGYWHVGGDNLASWPSAPTSNYFAGSIDDVAIYPTALNLTQIDTNYTNSGRTVAVPVAPTDAYGKAVFNAAPDLYWRLDDASGPTAADASGNNSTGLYSGAETFKVASPVAGATGTAVTFDGSTGTIGSNQQFSNPTVYTESAWFNTTTTHGGKIIGFGAAQTGLSGSYDRHVYMLDTGQLVFGAWTGVANLATSPLNYNDGKWHQLVATQGPSGMALYVDGQLVATNADTQAQAYAGYWRVGGDSDWGGDSPYFAGTIDEVAVWASSALTSTQVQSLYAASPAAVNAAPTAAFSSSCVGGVCSFNGAGSTDPNGTVASYAWSFGDGTTGTGVAPTHTYAASGTYSVSLVVTDNGGATSPAVVNQVPVTVTNQAPVAVFNSTATNLSVAFDGSTSADPDGTVASYAWTFGDGSTSTLAKPTHVYAAAGSYTVTLTVTDNLGLASAPVSHVVTVTAPNQAPVAAFTSVPTNLSVAFDGSTSADPDGTVASYAWTFGDGSTSTLAKPTHVYAAAGSYTVTLTVTDNQGLASAPVSHVVTVTAPNQAPVAVFSSVSTNLSVAFDGSTSADPDGTVASYAWTFGDGSTSTLAKPTHVYAAAGSYTVTLTVTDNLGLASAPVSHVVTVTAANQAPVAAFTSVPTNLSVAFDGSTSADPDGTVASYAWTFGDGSTSTLAKPTHVYAAAGSYTVTLTVTDNLGLASAPVSHVVTVTAANQAPVAAFTSVPTNLSVAFDGSTSADPDGTVASYAWTFGDGSTSTLAKPTHVYAAAGSYTVTLTVTDNQGLASAPVSHVVTVTAPANQPPVAAFTSVPTNLSVAFDGTTSTDPDGTIASYAWAFGDGTTSTAAKPTHVYAAAGSYNVTLTVTDNSGATNAVTHTVVVSAAANKPPVASFTATPVNLTVSFNAAASSDPDGTIATYAWAFGDGTTGSGVTASHTYASAGTYAVVLTVTDNQGASTSLTTNVLVNPVTSLFSDTFTRTTANSLGTANSGGAWTDYGTASSFNTNGSIGQITMVGPSDGPSAVLKSVSQTNLNLLLDSGMTKIPTGNGAFMSILLRDDGTTANDYRFKLRYMSDGTIHIAISKSVNGGETTLTEVVVPGLTYNVGDTLRARVIISGTGTTTIAGKVWKVGTTEPAANQVSVTDTEASLQKAGAVGVQTYLSGSSTNAPITMNLDNLSATAN